MSIPHPQKISNLFKTCESLHPPIDDSSMLQAAQPCWCLLMRRVSLQTVLHRAVESVRPSTHCNKSIDAENHRRSQETLPTWNSQFSLNHQVSLREGQWATVEISWRMNSRTKLRSEWGESIVCFQFSHIVCDLSLYKVHHSRFPIGKSRLSSSSCLPQARETILRSFHPVRSCGGHQVGIE